MSTKAFEHLIKITEALKTNGELHFGTFHLWIPFAKNILSLHSSKWVLIDWGVTPPAFSRSYHTMLYQFQRKGEEESEKAPLTYRVSLIPRKTRLQLFISQRGKFVLALLVTKEFIKESLTLFSVRTFFPIREIKKTYETVIKPLLSQYVGGIPV